jgi:hypothetical protein
MKAINITLLLSIVLLSAGCGAKYAKVQIEDVNKDNTYVYGDLNGEARQLKNTYPNARPETLEKAAKFRNLVESELVSGFGAK